VLDGDDVDAMLGVVDAVDHAVVAASSAVQPFEVELQRFADAWRVGGKRAVDELDDGGRDLLGQPVERALCRRRPGDLNVARALIDRRSA